MNVENGWILLKRTLRCNSRSVRGELQNDVAMKEFIGIIGGKKLPVLMWQSLG
jgi:hypothetical protein